MKERIAVIGGGLMGIGIAQAFATQGHPVQILEPAEAARAALPGRLRARLAAAEADPALAEHVGATADLAAAVGEADVVIEAAPEKLPLKREIFADLVAHAPRQAILSSNSSVIPISRIAEGLPTAGRMIGMHWWNPAELIPLVEVIEGPESDAAVVTRAMELLARIGKKLRDVPGFVGNRLQHALWREALHMIDQGICDAKTLDDCVKHSFGLRLAVLGPLENIDLIGLDLTRDIHATMHPDLNRDNFPSPLLDRLIGEGKLGFKSGEGLQSWTAGEMAEVRRRLTAHLLAAREAA